MTGQHAGAARLREPGALVRIGEDAQDLPARFFGRVGGEQMLPGNRVDAGRGRVLSSHAWPNSMKRLDAIIDRCVASFVTPSQLHPQSP